MKQFILGIGAALVSISKKMSLIFAMFLMSCASAPVQKNTQDDKPAPQKQEAIILPKAEFRVGAHTKLFISVYNELDLTDEVIVLPDGTIDYAYVGKIVVKDLTPKQVEYKLTQILQKDYLVHPQVTVKVKEFGMVYVLGKVKSPGILKLVEQETVLQALTSVGGFSDGAQRKVIQVIRTVGGEKKMFTLSLKETQGGGLDLVESLYLLPNDTILVE